MAEHPKQYKTLGDWQVQRIFASGSQFTLYIVTKDGSSDRLAKVPSTEYVGLAKKECAILQKLNHPNIIKVIDSDLNTDIPYMITEYGFNGRFTEGIREWNINKLDHDSIKRAFQPVFDCVGWLHSQGITHGYFDQSHVVLTEDNTPKIINFTKAEIHSGTYFDTSMDLTTLADLYGVAQHIAREIVSQFYQVEQEKWQQKIDALNIASPKALNKN
jgi:serine/threonine protein kinase